MRDIYNRRNSIQWIQQEDIEYPEKLRPLSLIHIQMCIRDRHNFERAGKCDQITLLEGDAMEIIKTLDGPYDFIFVDAAKAQYIHYFPELMRLLEQDGYLVSDNVLQLSLIHIQMCIRDSIWEDDK